MSKVKKVAVVVFGQTLNLLIGFLMLPYLARALSVHDNGTYNQGLLILTIATSLAQLGLPGIINVFFADKKHDQHSVFWTNLLAISGTGLLSSLVILALNSFISNKFENPDLQPLMQMFAWKAAFELAFMTINTALVFFDRVKQSVSIVVGTNLVRLAGMFIACQYLHSMYWLLAAVFAMDVLQCVFGFFALPRHIRTPNFSNLNWGDLRAQVAIGFPLGLSGMVGILMNQMDKLMISSLLNPAALAIYANGSLAVPFVGVVFNSISQIVLPEFSKLYKAGDLATISRLKNRVITASAALIYPIIMPVLFFSKTLIVLYLSAKYAESYLVFVLYNMVVFFRINNYRDILIASGNTRFILKFTLISLALSIPLNFLFIKGFGLYGPAISSFLCRMILVVSFTWMTLRVLKIKLSEFAETRRLNWITGISLAVAGVFFGVHQLVKIPAFVVFYIGAGTAICYLIFLRYGLLERVIVTTFLKKIPFVGKRIERRIDLIVSPITIQ